MADWWPAPEGVRVSPDGSWSVGEFRIVHLPSLRFLKERLVFEDEGAFLVEGERRLPVAVDGPAFQVVELRLDAEAAEARVVLDDGSEEVAGARHARDGPEHRPRRVPGARRARAGRLLAIGPPGAPPARRGDPRPLLPPRGEPPAGHPGRGVTGRALAARAKELAREAGFDLAGVARADAPPDLAFFAEWVARGHAGEMGYLTSQVAKRSDLRAAFPWARSVLCVGLQYDTPHPYSTEAPADRGWISRYAWGDDYHDVMKAMLERLAARLPGRGRALRGARLRGHRPDRREGLGRRRRDRRLGQEHLPPPPRARLVVLPRRARDRPATCPPTTPRAPTSAAAAPPVSTPARPARSSRPSSSTRRAASAT